MKKLSALVPLLVGCAHSYTLDPLDAETESFNGIPLATLAQPSCVLQAGYQYSNANEMLVKVRVTNAQKAPFDVDAGAFAMQGPKETVKASPLPASDPEKYLKELRSAAENLEERTRMESYQGVEALGALKGEKSDASIDAANEAYRRKVKEAERAREQAEAIRKRISVIEPAALRKTTVKPGESAEGALIFRTEFGETGVVTIESTLPACSAKLRFMLKK